MAEKKLRKLEQWQDMIARLYPEHVSKDGERVLSRTVTFQVCDECNLACKYCYQINKGKRSMSFDTAKEFIDLLLSGEKGFSEYINPEISPAIVLEFIGGEPFLEVELIDQIVDYFRERTIELMHPWATNYCISICSNGVLYFDDRVQRFLNKNKDHMSFSITIDGNKELHDSCRVFPDGSPSYDIAVAGANDWIAKGNYMGSKITIAPGNLNYLYDAIIHMVNLGYLDINANCVYEKGWEQEHAIEFYKQLKNVADYFLDNDLVGEVYCSLFEENFFKPKDENDLQNWCFKKGTMVLTPNGNVPIEYLKVGDDVISGSGNTQKLIKIIKHNSENTASIKATGMFETYTTKDHPYLVKKFSHIGNKGIYRYYNPEWLPVENIKKGDKIALFKHRFGNTDIANKNIAYLIGRYIGDGWESTTGYKLCCSFDEFDELKNIFDAANINYSYDKYRTVMQFNIFKNNVEFINILSQAGKYAHGKMIPAEVFNWNKESVACLLKGLFEADGYFSKKKNSICFNTVSKTLANDVMLLLRGFNLFPTCYFCNRAGKQFIEGREVNVKDRYEVYCNMDNTKSKRCSYDEINDVIWTTVTSVELDIEPYEVYNLTVENDHTFIANNVIVHNCGGNALMLACDPDGYLYPCIRYMESSLGDSRPPMRIGSVYEGIGTNKCHMDCLHCLKSIDRKTQSTDECFYCPIGEGCSWCSAYNYQEFGTPDKRATYICEMHKARSLANVYLWNKYYQKNNIDKKFKMYCTKEWALNIISEDEYNMLLELSE